MADIKLKQQKLTKVGNSVSLTIDAEFLRTQGLGSGDTVSVHYTDDGVLLLLTPQAIEKLRVQKKVDAESSKVSEELSVWTKQFIAENKQALEELAHLP